jgi:membrane-bound lytic murein transglycosylase B
MFHLLSRESMNTIPRILVCIAGLGLCCLAEDVAVRDSLSAEPVDPRVAHAEQLAELTAHLASHGFDITPHLAHASFRVHDSIASSFRKSAETTGYVNYTKSTRAVSDSEKTAAYNRELAAYKEKLGYDGKQRAISRFMREHRQQLIQSEQTYGVPLEVTAAVIGMESTFGRVTGRYYAFNVYVSMYICGYRKAFALAELEELMKFTKKKNIDMFSLRSSYGGAMGNMQFIPSSLNRWFVGAGDDLTDMDVTIASVANYLGHFLKREKGNMEKAVYHYNTSMFYTRTVLDLAEYARGLREVTLR